MIEGITFLLLLAAILGGRREQEGFISWVFIILVGYAIAKFAAYLGGKRKIRSLLADVSANQDFVAIKFKEKTFVLLTNKGLYHTITSAGASRPCPLSQLPSIEICKHLDAEIKQPTVLVRLVNTEIQPRHWETLVIAGRKNWSSLLKNWPVKIVDEQNLIPLINKLSKIDTN